MFHTVTVISISIQLCGQ